MAGKFSLTKYEMDVGLIVPIRVQPETLGLSIGSVANTAPTEAVEAGLPSAKVSKGKNAMGIGARSVTVQFTGEKPDGIEGDTAKIPVLQKSVWEGYGITETGTYQGKAVKVIGKSSESVK